MCCGPGCTCLCVLLEGLQSLATSEGGALGDTQGIRLPRQFEEGAVGRVVEMMMMRFLRSRMNCVCGVRRMGICWTGRRLKSALDGMDGHAARSYDGWMERD